MALDRHMIHQCTVVRDTVTGEDPIGGPGAVTTSTIYQGACRFVERVERIAKTDRSEYQVITTYRLFLPAWAGVLEYDRLSAVTVDGETLSNAFRLGQVVRRRSNAVHHVMVELERFA